jgi:ABC-type nitrate/sulfonate/bicarbonate transport system substrate-binding protein
VLSIDWSFCGRAIGRCLDGQTLGVSGFGGSLDMALRYGLQHVGGRSQARQHTLVTLTTRDFLRRKRDVARRFIAAYLDGLELFLKNPRIGKKRASPTLKKKSIGRRLRPVD